jgi:hypothetical protein
VTDAPDEEPLSCPAHPDGAEDDCAACNAILDALASELEKVSEDLATGKTIPPPLSWAPGHGPKLRDN